MAANNYLHKLGGVLLILILFRIAPVKHLHARACTEATR
jgi:hypothetical protein